MYHKHHTPGIVISGKAEGNDSRRIDVLTERFGLLNARVQGGRNLNSKLRSGCQDFSLGEFSFVHGKSGWRVVSARPRKNYFEIFRNNPEKLLIVGNVLKLVRKLTAEEESKSRIFDIILNLLKFLEKSDTGQDAALAECLALLRILHSLGYMRNDPELSIPISYLEIESKDLEMIAPRRERIVKLINESLKST